MTLAEVRSRGHEAALDVAERLRANARSADRLPFEVRRDVFDLVLRGYPQTAARVLDEALAVAR